MGKFMQIKLKEYIDMLGDDDLRFMQQMYTLIKKHMRKTGRL